MYVIMCSVVLLLVYTAAHSLNFGIQDSDHFGPYYINFTKLDKCLGPKSKNASDTVATLTIDGKHFFGHFNLTFFKPTHIDEVKIMVYTLQKDNTKNMLWTYRLNDPCKHFVFANIIQAKLNASNCYINKGNYLVDVDFDEATLLFFGTSFFYGEFLFKISVFSKKGNIMCLILGTKFCKPLDPFCKPIFRAAKL